MSEPKVHGYLTDEGEWGLSTTIPSDQDISTEPTWECFRELYLDTQTLKLKWWDHITIWCVIGFLVMLLAAIIKGC